MTDPRESGTTGIGLIGAGNISDTYLQHLREFTDLDVRFVADLDVARAVAQAEKHNVPGSGPVEQLLADDGVDLVVNLTIPAAHVEVDHQIVAAGKHLWSEKPIGLNIADATALLDAADAAGVRVGCAPDTVLGAGLQSAFRAVADGVIGTPLSATTTFLSPGAESWHPAPEFLFARGGGPLFDMGPYYLTTLVWLLGPVSEVAGASSRARAERVIGSGPRAGTRFPVEVATHTQLLLAFADGGAAQSTFSADSALRRIGVEVTGTEGALVLPDPNQFDGASQLWRLGAEEPEELPVAGIRSGRGLGVAEMARAIRAGVPHRADGRLAAHVLEVMQTGLALTGAQSSPISSRVERPALMPTDFATG